LMGNEALVVARPQELDLSRERRTPVRLHRFAQSVQLVQTEPVRQDAAPASSWCVISPVGYWSKLSRMKAIWSQNVGESWKSE
jgi:hypothetical protein